MKALLEGPRNNCRHGRVLIFLYVVLVALGLSADGRALAENWPGWRGPRGDGTSLEKTIPVSWSGTDGVAWKTPIPGKGHASPIIWDRDVFVRRFNDCD